MNTVYNIDEDICRTFIETKEFQRDWKTLDFSDEDLRMLQNQILNDMKDYPLGSSVHKIRFSSENTSRGKSSSARVVFVDFIKLEKVYFLKAYGKKDQATLTQSEERELRKIAKKLEEEN